MPQGKRGYVHPDHWDENQRKLIAHLREQHLPGVDTDDEASITFTIEQARLLLVTAGGLLGLTLTQMLDAKRSICLTPVYVEIPLLSVALALGWVGLLLGGHLRTQRVTRRYDIYNAHLDAHLEAKAENRSIDLTNFDDTFDSAFDPERKTQATMRWLQIVAAGFASLGILSAGAAAIGTVVPERCIGGIQPTVTSASHPATPQE